MENTQKIFFIEYPYCSKSISIIYNKDIIIWEHELDIKWKKFNKKRTHTFKMKKNKLIHNIQENPNDLWSYFNRIVRDDIPPFRGMKYNSFGGVDVFSSLELALASKIMCLDSLKNAVSEELEKRKNKIMSSFNKSESIIKTVKNEYPEILI